MIHVYKELWRTLTFIYSFHWVSGIKSCIKSLLFICVFIAWKGMFWGVSFVVYLWYFPFISQAHKKKTIEFFYSDINIRKVDLFVYFVLIVKLVPLLGSWWGMPLIPIFRVWVRGINSLRIAWAPRWEHGSKINLDLIRQTKQEVVHPHCLKKMNSTKKQRCYLSPANFITKIATDNICCFPCCDLNKPPHELQHSGPDSTGYSVISFGSEQGAFTLCQ